MKSEISPYFFSFIIPAHNEEKYLAGTIIRLCALDYPKELFEVIIIENGSTDATFRIAQSFAGSNIQVFKNLEKGVSKAKNFGMEKVSAKSEWIVFLDADTILEKNFLRDINAFLHKNSGKNFVIGTTRVRPLENNKLSARMWMRFYDFVHRFMRASLAIQIMKTKLKDNVHFDEEKSLAEDLNLIKDACRYGKFFYINTDTVFTSTRRFEKIGWFHLFFKWTTDAVIWRVKDVKKEYPVIR